MLQSQYKAQFVVVTLVIAGVIGFYFWGNTIPKPKDDVTNSQHNHKADDGSVNFDENNWIKLAEERLTNEERKEWNN